MCSNSASSPSTSTADTSSCADQVELHVVGVAGGAEGQLLLARQGPGVRVPGEVEVVVEGVDGRVADVWVDAVLDGLADGGVEVAVLGVRRVGA